MPLLGQFTFGADASDWDVSRVRVPPAFDYRAARYLDAAADIVAEGTVPGNLGRDDAESLAATFRSDAMLIRQAVF